MVPSLLNRIRHRLRLLGGTNRNRLMLLLAAVALFLVWFNHRFLTSAAAFDRSKETIYFMFTTIPPHQHRITEILKMMKQQTLVPDAVILTVPKTYHRFRNETVAVSPNDFLRVHVTEEDTGPLGKYQGVAMAQDSDIVIVSDDDVDFSNTFIEDAARAIAGDASGNSIYSASLDHFLLHSDVKTKRSDGIMGYSGVAARAYMLRNLPKLPPGGPCFLADDVVVSYHAVRHGYSIKQFHKRHEDADSTKEQHDATSIHAHHIKEGFQVNDKCSEALFLLQ